MPPPTECIWRIRGAFRMKDHPMRAALPFTVEMWYIGVCSKGMGYSSVYKTVRILHLMLQGQKYQRTEQAHEFLVRSLRQEQRLPHL
jgi:hypothetical protein